MNKKIDDILQLQELLDKGIISQAEFETLKSEIISNKEPATIDNNVSINTAKSKIKSLFIIIVILTSLGILVYLICSFLKNRSQNQSQSDPSINISEISDSDTIYFAENIFDDKTIMSVLKPRWMKKDMSDLYSPKLIGKKTYVLNDTSFLLVTLGFRNKEECHSCTGENDIALLKVQNNNLEIIDYLEGAACNGYSFYCDVSDYQIFSDENICLFLKACGDGMGFVGCRVTGFGIFNNKIKKIADFNTSLDEFGLPENSDPKPLNFTRSFRFVKGENKYYDLEWTTTDLKSKKKSIKKLPFDEILKEYKE